MNNLRTQILAILAQTYLLLGSNLGDRQRILRRAATMISQQVGPITALSSLYETAPWGVKEQPAFLNQVAEVQTDLAPEEVLRHVLEIEQRLGRVRYERWGARHLDIDILYFDSLVMDTARLTIPHPRLHERRFTLVPLVELMPDYVHPVLGQTTLELLATCPDEGEVVRLEA